jgi:hypothetical protein
VHAWEASPVWSPVSIILSIGTFQSRTLHHFFIKSIKLLQPFTKDKDLSNAYKATCHWKVDNRFTRAKVYLKNGSQNRLSSDALNLRQFRSLSQTYHLVPTLDSGKTKQINFCVHVMFYCDLSGIVIQSNMTHMGT